MRKFRHGSCVCLVLIAVLSGIALAQAPVTDDVFVSSATPNSNNGTSPSLVVQAPGGWTLIKFDLSQLPFGTPSSAVTKATVKLYVSAATAQGSFDLYRVDTAWKEGTLTYSNSTTPYQSAQGLNFFLVNPGTACPSTNQCVTTASKYVILDVTSIVKDWLDSQNGVLGAHANNGIAFKPSSGSSISVTFDSKESTTSSHAPEIDIVLTPASFVSTLATTSPIGNTGTPSSPNIALTGLIPSGNLSGTYNISINGNVNGNASTATAFQFSPNQCASGTLASGIQASGNANCSSSLNTYNFNISGSAATASSAGTATSVPWSGVTTGSNTAALTIGAGGSLAPTGTGAITANMVPTGAPGSLVAGDVWLLSGHLNFSDGSNTFTTALLGGGNVFTGGKQTLAAGTSGYASLNFPNSGTAPSSPAIGDLWLTNADTHLQFRDKNVATHSLAFTDDAISSSQISGTYSNAVTFNNGSNSFTGSGAGLTSLNASNISSGTLDIARIADGSIGNAKLTNSSIGVTTGSGILVTGTSSLGGSFNIANTGVLTFNGRNGTVSPAQNDYSFAQLSGTDTPTSHLAYDNQANTYSGGKQTMPASAATYAALNFPSSSTAPSSPVTGDVWLNNSDIHLQFRDNAGSPLTHSLMFTDDSLQNAQLSGTYSNNLTFSGANTFSNASNSFTGSGAGLTSLNASNISSGTLADARLSANVALLNGTQTFSGVNTFSSASNSFTGSGAGLTALNAGNLASGIVPAARLSGSYGIDISGNAATATTAGFATSAGSAASVPFSGVTAGTNTVALTIDTGGSLTTSGTGSINATQLGGVAAATYVRNDQANTYTAGTRQTFKASSTTAGLSLDSGTAADPTTLASGDIWFNTTTNHLGFYNGTATKILAFSDDNITGNATNVTGIVAVANGGTGASTASGARTNLSAAASGANSDITSLSGLTTALSIGQGGTGATTASGGRSSLGAAGTGTCTNQAVTATSGAGVTCTTITSAYVNNSIALTGTDINTSNQVVATHLTSPLPAAQGGTGFNGSAAANGSLPIGNGAGFSLATLTAGSNVTITNAAGSITIAAAGSATPSFSALATGTNTTAAMTVGTGASLSTSGSGTINATALSGELAATTATASTIAARDASANLTANQFSGSGAGLTSLNASNLSTGTIPGARMAPTRTSASTTINTASSGTTVSATVACPSGVLLGGGGQATTTSGIPVALVESYPSSATQWTATAVDNGNGNNKNLTATAWVVCGGS